MNKFLIKLSLMKKMLLLTTVAGAIGWIVLDYMQTNRLNDFFSKEFSERLKEQATEDRLRFDQHVKNYRRGVILISSQNSFNDYVANKNNLKNNNIIFHKARPVWFPNLSILRTLVQPRTVLMYDGQSKLREVFQTRREYIPDVMMNITNRLLEISDGQSFITMFDRVPYIMASEKVYDKNDRLLATLMLISPIDDEFMISSQGVENNSIVALLSEDSRIVITSSNYELVPVGTPLQSTKEKYISVGESFFDYGTSSFPIKFISFNSIADANILASSVMKAVRQDGVLVAAVFVGGFLLVMVFITRRVEGLGERVADFCSDTFKTRPLEEYKGDQLFNLEQRFQGLMAEVVNSRDKMRNDAAEKIMLVRKNIEEKENQLDMLQTATGIFGVGVIMRTIDGYSAANDHMKKIVLECGPVDQFVLKNGSKKEEVYFCNDSNGVERVFDIRDLGAVDNQIEIFLVQEVTEIKNKTKELEHQALHDSLTGLPNRALLLERLNQAIRVAQREYKMVALFMMDLDRFKEVNDTLGHHFGDLLLKEVADRLRFTLRDSDSVARFGGDEFAILLTLKNEERAIRVANKIISAIDKEFILEGHSVSTEISIGIAMFPEHGDDPSMLMKRADIAMYVAKKAHAGFAFYDSRQDPHSINRLSLMGDLRHAIENDELVPYYQPKIDIKTGKVTSVEALIRWHHSEDGFVPPDMFVPIAEQTGLIKQLTYWVVDKAIHQCARWRRMGIEIDVSINLSARNLQDSNLVPYIKELLITAAIKPEWVVLEITESTIMASPTEARNTLLKLDEMGIGLSIDDFGTGHSSLAYIKRLPVSEIKIDKSFVMDMITNDNDAVIVRATIDLAHNLGLKVIAEGVETKEAFDTLEILGCDMAQGYLFSPAIPEDKFVDWYNTSPWGNGDENRTASVTNIRRIK